jgi:excisionase family DNA binding protein
VTANRAAEELGLHVKTVYKEVEAGRILAVRYGRRVLIPRDNLVAFTAELPEVKK